MRFNLFENKDRKAVEEMVKSFSRDLYHFARLRLNSNEEAEDVVQQTFLKAYRSIHTFRRGAQAKPWLYAIMLNTIREHYQKTANQPTLLSYEHDPEIENELIDVDADPESILSRKLDLEMLSAAIKTLPEEFAAPLLLREVNDLTYNEIASILGAPIGTVMSRLHRARRALSEILLKADSLTGEKDKPAAAQDRGGEDRGL
jgi:RNA polymerase sigma-70 factor (ECF subfamily)